LAPSGTEQHPRPKLDQARDQETKPIFGLEDAAERLLQAVADGAAESVELARELVAAVIGAPLVQLATELDELLRTRNPLALVRAVELAAAVRQVKHSKSTPASSPVVRDTLLSSEIQKHSLICPGSHVGQ
jgi:hypothetical protein